MFAETVGLDDSFDFFPGKNPARGSCHLQTSERFSWE